MAQITSVEGLSRLKEELREKRNRDAGRIRAYVNVGMGTCGIAVGALDVLRTLNDEIKVQHLDDVVVSQTGCMGLCSHEPILEVTTGRAPKVAYGRVTPDKVKRIVREHIIHGVIVEEFVVDTTLFPTI
jgi:NADP-reducing hydrogenase subunit HndB